MRKLLIALLLVTLCLPLAAHAEVLRYDNDLLKLHFDLPEGWTQAEMDGMDAFADPAESGAILISATDTQVTPAMVEGFSIEIVKEWIEEQGGGSFTNIEELLFAKTTDAAGNMYVLSSCGYMYDGTPFIYSVYAFTATDGTLGAVIGIAINNEAGQVTLNWFDQMILDNIPADVMAELMEAIGPLE